MITCHFCYYLKQHQHQETHLALLVWPTGSLQVLGVHFESWSIAAMNRLPRRTAAIKRSACDLCRAKRVRCLRAENSTAPCARCSHTGARCVMGAPGIPGRPRKSPVVQVSNDSTPGGSSSAESPVEFSAPAVLPTKNTWLGNGPQLDAGDTLDDSFVFCGSPSIVQSPAPGEDGLMRVDQLGSPSQLQLLQGSLGADDELDAMMRMDGGSDNVLDMAIDPLLQLQPGTCFTSLLPACFSSASSLMRFREEMDRRIAVVDAYFSDPFKVLQGCSEEEAGKGGKVENPAGLLLTCTTEFIDILQGLAPTAGLCTELLLLVLSSYLALMRLYDTLFHCIYQCLCLMPPDSLKSVKVKAVLRIGGISALQDMPLQTYATGILDAVRGQVRALERCMGIPAVYCLSNDAGVTHETAAPGMFSRADRVQLFCAIMAQEDVKARRDGKSYVESIRANIQESVVLLGWMTT